ncbi:MAG: heparinase II/III domain-containing protein, partial [Usitatibacter sp.]
MWLRKARAGCTEWATNAHSDVFQGWHDGYASLDDPVMHRRRIVLDKPTRRIVVTDTLEMSGAHDVELFFHCHESSGVRVDGTRVTITRDGRSLVLRLPGGGEIEVVRGGTDPIGGWVSRAFDRKEPAPTIVWRARLRGNSALRTEIAVG